MDVSNATWNKPWFVAFGKPLRAPLLEGYLVLYKSLVETFSWRNPKFWFAARFNQAFKLRVSKRSYLTFSNKKKKECGQNCKRAQ